MVEFLVNNSKFLSTHDLSPIPAEFLQRIGELSKVKIVERKGTMFWFHAIEQSFSKAKEYIYAMSNEHLMSALQIIQERVEAGAEYRIIIPWDYHPPSSYKPIKGSKVSYRTLPEVKLALALTEKDCGAAFLDMTGKFDYSSIIGEIDASPTVHKWIKDLFEYYWEKAQPLEI